MPFVYMSQLDCMDLSGYACMHISYHTQVKYNNKATHILRTPLNFLCNLSSCL